MDLAFIRLHDYSDPKQPVIWINPLAINAIQHLGDCTGLALDYGLIHVTETVTEVLNLCKEAKERLKNE
jgi:hypothetical protein